MYYYTSKHKNGRWINAVPLDFDQLIIFINEYCKWYPGMKIKGISL